MHDHVPWLKSRHKQLSSKTLHLVSNNIVYENFDSLNKLQFNCRHTKSKILIGNVHKQSQNSQALVALVGFRLFRMIFTLP